MNKKPQGCDYNTEIKKLKSEGPCKSYLLYGPEDYLLKNYYNQLKKMCLPEGDNSFNYHKFDDTNFDSLSIKRAINSPPFMGDKVFVEIRTDELAKLDIDLTDLPDYCVLVIICDDIDKRLKVVKSIECVLMFCQAEQNSLVKWIKKRFDSYGKKISDDAVNRLIYVSGDLMSSLIPEIEKVSTYSSNEIITVSDVDAVANHIADADIFDMVECMSQKNYDKAINLISELLKDKNNNCISILSSISFQYRRLYIAKCIKNRKTMMSILNIKFDFIADKLLQIAKKYSLENLKFAVSECCTAEYRLKSSADNDLDIIKTLFINLWKNCQ